MNLQEHIRKVLSESVSPQVRRRHGEFDRMLKHYRDSFINHPYKTFNSFWNTVLEVTMETLYHAWFSKTVSDDDWEESAEYISNYLIKKYKEETKQMWNDRDSINESEEKSGKYIKAVKVIVNDFKNEEFVCDIDVWYYGDKYEIVVKIDKKEFEKKYESKHIDYANILMTGYLDRLKRSIIKEIKNFLPVDLLVWFKNTDCNKSLNESEIKTNSSLHRLLNMLFDGFDDIYYDWANYMCGMGECCDPYAIGFTLPNKHYDDYIFKLVDGDKYDDLGDYPKELSDELPESCYQQPDIKDPKFDTIVFYGHYAEEIEDYMGTESNWKSDLLKIINKQFGCEAWKIIIT